MEKRKVGTCCALAMGLAMTGAAATAQAGTVFGFNAITSNAAESVNIGESQLRLDVSDAGSNQVAFKFYQDGSDAAVITQIFFDDSASGLDFSTFSITDSGSGVAFSEGANPGHLPGANPSDFQDFQASADNPAPQNGVSPGEFVTFTFALNSGSDISDVIDALTDSDLSVGVHVQSFANGKSESFVNDPHTVPTPSAALAGLGMLSLLGLSRRKRRQTA